MHPLRLLVATTAVLVCSVFFVTVPVHGQSMDMLRQQLMQQGGQTSDATGNIPSIQGGGAVRVSETMPEGVDQMLPQQSDILFDRPVDPDTYVIGPGDVLGVYFWGSIEMNYMVRVTPEGYLIIPTVGTITIAGMTISEAAEAFNRAIAENYDNIEVSLYLVEPRRFRLQVSGLVYVPGMHAAHAVERVSDVLERAGLIFPGPQNLNEIGEAQQINISTPPEATVSVSTDPGQEQAAMPNLQAYRGQHAIGRTNPSTLGRSGDSSQQYSSQSYPVFSLGANRGSSIRNIRIHRNDEIIDVDLLRFLKLGDLDQNPYVQSGDHIEVLPYTSEVGVFEEVHDQGFYEFSDGDRISDLIAFGGGLTSQADSVRAELVRFDSDGRSLLRLQIDLNDALLLNQDNPAYRLRDGDRLFIRPRVEYMTYRDVVIGGEVRFTGQYPIGKESTTLTELISMAGGFTGYENLGEARLLREADFAATDHEYERISGLLATERTYQENQYLVSYLRSFAGSVNIDFEKLFTEHDLSYDVVLRDGDIIYIPMKRELVNVMGAVKEPGYFSVLDGEDYAYYLEKAGGLNWNGDKRNIYVYKADTGQNYNMRYTDVTIEGGDTILVLERSRRNFWSYFREYSGYLTTVATIALIAIQVSN